MDKKAHMKAGRKRIELDEKKLEQLCTVQCSDEEIAAHLGVTRKTIQRRKAEPKFAEIIERGKAMGRGSLRSAQFKLAMEGNATMQIWLGKQLLGQTDKTEITGKDGTPVVSLDLTAIRQAVEAEVSTLPVEIRAGIARRFLGQ